jgi:D-serine deaminase-like pyridoxal phosphate-dependent protein
MVVIDMESTHSSGFFRAAHLTPAALVRQQIIVSNLRNVEVSVQMIFSKLLMACTILVRRALLALSNTLTCRRYV